MPTPVVITVYSDRSFTFITKTPPATVLIKKAAGIESGSPTPHTKKVGKITRAQARGDRQDQDAGPERGRHGRRRAPDRRLRPQHGHRSGGEVSHGQDEEARQEAPRSARSKPEGKTYPLDQAVQIVKDCATAKFKESIDISVNLGIDAKKSDQNVRGSTVLPHGNGKNVKVAVFAQGAKADEAKAAGADIVGMQDLADKMKAGDLRFQVVIAEPAAMRVVGAARPGARPARPHAEPEDRHGDAGHRRRREERQGRHGQVQHRQGGDHPLSIGSADFEADKIKDNLIAVMRDIRKHRPASAKGIFIKKLTLSTTMGPGIHVDVGRCRSSQPISLAGEGQGEGDFDF